MSFAIAKTPHTHRISLDASLDRLPRLGDKRVKFLGRPTPLTTLRTMLAIMARVTVKRIRQLLDERAELLVLLSQCQIILDKP